MIFSWSGSQFAWGVLILRIVTKNRAQRVREGMGEGNGEESEREGGKGDASRVGI